MWRMSLKGLSKRLKRKAEVQIALLLTLMSWAEGVASDWVDDFVPEATPARGQVSAILTVVVLGVVLIVGTLIYSQIQNSLPSPSNNELDNASQNVTGTFADAMDLAPVIMIVLIASVVLAVVQQFR